MKSKKKTPKKKRTNKAGYILIYSPNHPFPTEGQYIFEHRLVLEDWLRTNKPDHPALVEVDGTLYLRRKWRVHHWNEVKYDNNLDNLHPVSSIGEHNRIHTIRCLTKYLETLDEEAKARWKGAMVRGMAIKKKLREKKKREAAEMDMYISAKEAFSKI